MSGGQSREQYARLIRSSVEIPIDKMASDPELAGFLPKEVKSAQSFFYAG